MKSFWKWICQWGSPQLFYLRADTIRRFIKVPTYSMVILGVFWGLVIAPPDYFQGNVYRIIYLHVPMAFLAQSFYFFMACSAFVFLVWKIKIADIANTVLAPLGLCFTILSLLTGSIWGKPTWGTYWVWDARLTSMLILAFLYLGVIVLRSLINDNVRAQKFCAVLSLLGAINLPVIKFSVEWWNTLHQPASITLNKAPTMPYEMWLPLFFNIFAYYLLALYLMLKGMQVVVLNRERRTSWVQALFND